MSDEPLTVLTADTDAEVLVDDTWCFGVIAQWRRNREGDWWAWARVAAPDGSRILLVPADRVRKPELDWSKGRAATSSE